ncbi:hypothetical protein [Fortiea contorta]|uniref:hypothetical protein n=1 Tax=Fortiea contorta TaxID=1892405 RepID=UPI00034C5EA9|nr:hypothetical protein [Fortiea contorta]
MPNSNSSGVYTDEEIKVNQNLCAAVTKSSKETDIFAEWKSIDFWKEQSLALIPLFSGLAVTGGLRITGWLSIPVYVITADSTRWLIAYLQSQVSAPATNPSVDINHQKKSLKIAYSIVHAIPGRIRFHVPQIASDRAYAQRLEKLLQTDAKVMNVRVNYGASSVAIAFQPQEVSVPYWVTFLELALQTNCSQIVDIQNQDLSGV